MEFKKVTDNLIDKSSIVYKLQELVWKVAREFDRSLKVEDVHLEHPENLGHGDYATNVAMVLAKKIKKTPIELAKETANRLPKLKEIEKIEVAPPGFINFWLSKDYLFSQLAKVLEEKSRFGENTIGIKEIKKNGQKISKPTKIMVEFAHPNTHKPFHIGHLRNICLGESLCRILEANGFKIIRTNYQGDVGLHIAKCLWAIKKTKDLGKKRQNLKTLDEKIDFLGKAYVEGSKAYGLEKEAKKEIIKINEQIYRKDPEIIPLWQETRKWSLDYFDRIYKRVYTKFDRLYFESEMVEGKEIAKKLVKKGILKISEGAIVFNGKKYGLDTRVFVNSVGFPTYEAKELKLAELEFSEFGEIEKCIHVVGPEQTSFFKVTFKVEELLDSEKYKGRQHHLVYGLVRLKKGKMSSREGKVILGEWLIDEVKSRLFEIVRNNKEYSEEEKKEIAEKTAIAAVKYSMLKFAPQTEIAFGIEESISLEGDSGPYLQYTYARCKSVLQKAGGILWERPSAAPRVGKIRRCPLGPIRDRTRLTPLVNKEELAILRTVYKFPEVVLQAGEKYSPNLICNYLFDLAQKYNLFYNKWSILKPAKDTSEVSPRVKRGGPSTSEMKGMKGEVSTLKGEEHTGRVSALPAGRHSVASNVKVEELRTFRLALTAATAQILKNGLNLLGIKVLEKM